MNDKKNTESVLKKEEDFHNHWANNIDINSLLVDETFEACTSPENRIILNKLGSIKGKKILEIGCGAGEASVYFAKKGANVIASDISDEMLNIVQELAAKHGVNLETRKVDSHSIGFENESFDIVFAANNLHHVDLNITLKEVKRVLKKDGIFVAWDPLAHNPLINIYRKIACKVRTEDEQPLKMKDLKTFKEYFSKVEFETAWFFTLWIFVKYYLIDRIDPNKERYWKKIIVENKKLEKLYYRLERMDRILVKIMPFMKRYCWNIIIFARK